MKSVFRFLAGLLWVASVSAQGTIAFNNTGSTSYRLFTNNAPLTSSNLMSGAGYRIGLYISTNLNAGQTGLEFVALTTNAAPAPAAGRFNGGTITVPGVAPGTRIRFQLRVWTLAAGQNWNEALAAAAADPLNVALGGSPLAFTTVGGNGNPPGNLFGTEPGQLTMGFVVGGLSYWSFYSPGFEPSYTRGQNGVLTFGVDSIPGWGFRLYSSADLKTWSQGPRYTNTPALSFTNPGTGNMFYRLVFEP